MLFLKNYWEKIKLLKWVVGRDYENTLSQAFKSGAERDLPPLLKTAKAYFPFFNQGYFPHFCQLKKEAELLVGVPVKETHLPTDLLGAYLPETGKQNGVILINKKMHPVFRLSTLAHELCHAVIYRYYKNKGCLSHATRMRARVSQFKDELYDKEELLADTFTAIGTYPAPDFEKNLANGDLIRNTFKIIFHLRKHYPEVAKGFWFQRGMILNLVLIIHFFRLRKFIYQHYAI